MRKLIAVMSLTAAVSGFSVSADAGETHAHTMLGPNDLKWSDVPSLPPGAKTALIEGPLSEPVPFTIRLRFPSNYRIPPHWHPAIERVTVITGTFNMGAGEKFDGSATTALTPGSIAIMQAKTPHFAWTEGDTIVQLHGVGPWTVNYVDAADDPRKK
jgi:quercetin dioxygenase-like cupin family protein